MAAGKGGKKGSGKVAEKGGEKGSSRLAGKPYKAALDDVLACTKVRHADFDQKATQLLDYHEKHGKRAADALKYLKDVAVGVERDDILNSRAYVYALLRKFDENAYHEMKASTGGEKPPADRDRSERKEKTERPAAGGDASSRAPGDASSRQPLATPPLQDYLTQALDLNPEAPEFNPGANWSGRLVGATPTQQSVPPPFPYGYYPGAAYPPVPYAQPAAYPGYGYPAAGYPATGYAQPGYSPYQQAACGGMPQTSAVPTVSAGGKKGGKGGRRKGEGKGERGGKDVEKADAKGKGDKHAEAAGASAVVEAVGS